MIPNIRTQKVDKFSKWARLMLLLQAIIFGLSQLWGIRTVIKQSLSMGKMPILNFSDSSLYLSQLKSALESRTNFPLWFVYEHRNSGTSPASNEIYLFWGQIGKLFAAGLFETYLTMIFISSLLTFLAISSLLNILNINLRQRIILTPVIATAGVGFGLGRPSPTQLTLWILIFGICRALEKEVKFPWINFYGILLLMTNPMYAIYYLIVIFLRLIWFREYKPKVLLRTSPLIFSISFFVLSQSHLFSQSVNERFGLLASHLPGAIRPTILLISSTLILNLSKTFLKVENLQLLNLLTIGLAISLNSQLITGKVFEMESHYRYVVNIMLWIVLLTLLREINVQQRANSKVLSAIAIATSVFFFVQGTKDINARTYTSDEIEIIGELQQDLYRNKVVLIKQQYINDDFYRSLPLIADIRLYWHPDLVFYDLGDSEILKRFSCTISSQYNLSDFRGNKQLIYGHKFENLKQLGMKSKYFPFLNPSNYQELESRQAILDFHKINLIRRLCEEGTYNYKADFVLTANKFFETS